MNNYEYIIASLPVPETAGTLDADSLTEAIRSQCSPADNALIDILAGGFDPEIARQVTGIFADSTSYRAAYNKLRSVFGNNTGRDYYQSAKRILSE